MCAELGIAIGGRTFTALRETADQHGFDYAHLDAARPHKAAQVRRMSDDRFSAAVRRATSWTNLAALLGYRTVLRGAARQEVEERILRLGLSTEHFRSVGYNGLGRLTAERPIFAVADGGASRLRHAAIGTAIAWFMERGCVASLPLESAAYDLVVDFEGSFYKVQVKTSTAPDREVGFSRSVYDATRASSLATGRVRRGPYLPGDVDYFFVVLVTGERYLIPYDTIGTSTSAVMGPRFEAFQV